MALASTHTTQTGTAQVDSSPVSGAFVLPSLLQCLVFSWSDQRAELLQTLAEKELWQVKIGRDVQDFLRCVFQLEAPLTIVDLPQRSCEAYAKLREVVSQTNGVNRSFLMVCGAENDPEEELWVRQLGAWVYLPGATSQSGLRLTFAEARKALARQSTNYVEASGYR